MYALRRQVSRLKGEVAVAYVVSPKCKTNRGWLACRQHLPFPAVYSLYCRLHACALDGIFLLHSTMAFALSGVHIQRTQRQTGLFSGFTQSTGCLCTPSVSPSRDNEEPETLFCPSEGGASSYCIQQARRKRRGKESRGTPSCRARRQTGYENKTELRSRWENVVKKRHPTKRASSLFLSAGLDLGVRRLASR